MRHIWHGYLETLTPTLRSLSLKARGAKASSRNSITDVEGERVNICQNIWSLLRGVGANFAGEKKTNEVGGQLENGLPTNLIQT